MCVWYLPQWIDTKFPQGTIAYIASCIVVYFMNFGPLFLYIVICIYAYLTIKLEIYSYSKILIKCCHSIKVPGTH